MVHVTQLQLCFYIPRSSRVSQCAQIKRNCYYCFLEHGFVWRSSESHVPRFRGIVVIVSLNMVLYGDLVSHCVPRFKGIVVIVSLNMVCMEI